MPERAPSRTPAHRLSERSEAEVQRLPEKSKEFIQDVLALTVEFLGDGTPEEPGLLTYVVGRRIASRAEREPLSADAEEIIDKTKSCIRGFESALELLLREHFRVSEHVWDSEVDRHIHPRMLRNAQIRKSQTER